MPPPIQPEIAQLSMTKAMNISSGNRNLVAIFITSSLV
jgi:hypothetical protein